MISRHIYAFARSLFLIVMPLISFCLTPLEAVFVTVLRSSPVAAALVFLKEPKPATMRVLGLLKPVYRDSYRTHGQSLDYRTYAT